MNEEQKVVEETIDYNKIIAQQLIRIGDILTAAFQGSILQYNHLARVSNELENLKETYSKLSTAYNDIKIAKEETKSE